MIITTSWDDGHPLDLKLLDLLEKYGLKATFYVPLHNRENQTMSKHDIKIISEVQELGGHTFNHQYLDKISNKEALSEIEGGKSELEQITGKELSAFCFPGGKFQKQHLEMVCNAGFLFGRTTNLLQTSVNTDSRLMHTTVQVYNHDSLVILKHCLKRRMIGELMQLGLYRVSDTSFKSLTNHFLHLNTTEVFHLWGHSWEIEQKKMWADLEEVFSLFSDMQHVRFLNNTECWQYLQNNSLV